ncbi:MAG: histidine phosphatase family protein [Ketobacter sp.]|nr:histidine phosphatase family protein [Ketobacter sp.]
MNKSTVPKQLQLILIRHGHPEWPSPTLISLSQSEQLLADYDDAHLSKTGKKAISILASQLPKALILSSDLPRARETAEIIVGGTEAIEFDPLLRELQPPRIATKPIDKLWAPRVIWLLVRWCCWPLGIGECVERPRVAWGRVAQVADKIFRYFETEEILILVGHGWFMTLMALYLRWCGAIEHGPFIPKTGYGAVSKYILRAKAA